MKHKQLVLLTALALLPGAGCTVEIIKLAGDGGCAHEHATPDAGKDALRTDIAPDTGAVSSLVDDSFSHFHAGHLSGAGAKIYISARGNVQLLDSHDINRDGYIDLAFAALYDGAAYKLNSYIYWGAKVGYSATNRGALTTFGARDITSADLNDDGYLDLVVSNAGSGGATPISSTLFWGSAAGYSTVKRDLIPTLEARGNLVVDLDGDGYLDIVVANSRNASTYKVSSYIYWGSAIGYSASKRLDLPTVGANDVAVGDLNNDGFLDIVFANYRDTKSFKVNSMVYWGGKAGFAATDVSALPTVGALSCSVADFNRDDWLDVLFANHNDDKQYKLNSYIYWGSKSGFSKTSRAQLPGVGARHSAVADLNGDGNLDVVLSNFFDGKTHKLNSYIYWGASGGFSVSQRTGLPTRGAIGAGVADLDGDGQRDLIFANHREGQTFQLGSYIYWGAKAGYSTAKRSNLPTVGTSGVSVRDPGDVASRKAAHTFTSRVLDTGVAAPTYTTLSWTAAVPAKTSIKLQLRSATSPSGLSSAFWQGPTGITDQYLSTKPPQDLAINTKHKGHRYIQYRATLSSDFARSPVLDKVVIKFR